MMNDYQKDKDWEACFHPFVKANVGPYLIMDSNDDDDRLRNSDMETVRLSLSVRIRRNKYLERYPDNITIRSKKRSGGPTELDKLKEGFGDLMFYGFAAYDDGPYFCRRWCLISLETIRQELWRLDFKELQVPNSGDHMAVFSRKQIERFGGVIASENP